LKKISQQNPQDKKRLRLVIVGADGGSDNKGATMQAEGSAQSMGVIVKGGGKSDREQRRLNQHTIQMGKILRALKTFRTLRPKRL